MIQPGLADSGGGAEVQAEVRHVVGGDRDHARVRLVDDRRGVGELEEVRADAVDGQIRVEADAEGSRALPDVRRGQLNGEARPRV